jgi:hypothetical protein
MTCHSWSEWIGVASGARRPLDQRRPRRRVEIMAAMGTRISTFSGMRARRGTPWECRRCRHNERWIHLTHAQCLRPCSRRWDPRVHRGRCRSVFRRSRAQNTVPRDASRTGLAAEVTVGRTRPSPPRTRPTPVGSRAGAVATGSGEQGPLLSTETLWRRFLRRRALVLPNGRAARRDLSRKSWDRRDELSELVPIQSRTPWSR